jgi:hypothetical protein
MHVAEYRCHEYINAPEQVVLRNTIVESKLIRQARLIAAPSTHHDLPPTSSRRKNGITVRHQSQAFFDSIDPFQNCFTCAKWAIAISKNIGCRHHSLDMTVLSAPIVTPDDSPFLVGRHGRRSVPPALAALRVLTQMCMRLVFR